MDTRQLLPCHRSISCLCKSQGISKHAAKELLVYALHMLHCLQDLVLLPNATTGLNAVISSVKLQPGDAVYSLNIG
jgi:hypothetical protein